jgi:hypothetical protein
MKAAPSFVANVLVGLVTFERLMNVLIFAKVPTQADNSSEIKSQNNLNKIYFFK